MYKLTNMLFQLKMDRKINPDIHYLSPGGYEIEKDGVTYKFDFCQSNGNAADDDDTVVVFDVYDFDEEYAKETNFSGEFKDPKDLLGNSRTRRIYWGIVLRISSCLPEKIMTLK